MPANFTQMPRTVLPSRHCPHAHPSSHHKWGNGQFWKITFFSEGLSVFPLKMTCIFSFIHLIFFQIVYIHFNLKEYIFSFISSFILFLMWYQICLLFSTFLTPKDLVLVSFCSLCFLDWGKFYPNQWIAHKWKGAL